MKIRELKNDFKVPKLNFSDIKEIKVAKEGRFKYITAKEIPFSTGIYIFFNDRMEVMYIGKAVNLRNRFTTHMSSGDTKVYVARKVFKDNIKYYSYAVCENNREAEMYEMIYTNLYKPKLTDLSKDEIERKVIIIDPKTKKG